MPADGMSLPLKKQDFGTSRWQLGERIHHLRRRAEGEWKLVYLLTDVGIGAGAG